MVMPGKGQEKESRGKGWLEGTVVVLSRMADEAEGCIHASMGAGVV